MNYLKHLSFSTPLVLLAALGLPAPAQDLPDAPGKNVVVKICGSCHGVDYISNLKHTKAEWRSVVDQMIGYGAVATDDEVETIVNYLAANFGLEPAPSKLMARRTRR